MVQYLETPIVEVKRDVNPPQYGMTVDGYTKRGGAPSSYQIRLEGERRFRRVMCLQFSNAGSIFVRIKGNMLFLHDYQIERAQEAR